MTTKDKLALRRLKSMNLVIDEFRRAETFGPASKEKMTCRDEAVRHCADALEELESIIESEENLK